MTPIGHIEDRKCPEVVLIKNVLPWVIEGSVPEITGEVPEPVATRACAGRENFKHCEWPRGARKSTRRVPSALLGR